MAKKESIFQSKIPFFIKRRIHRLCALECLLQRFLFQSPSITPNASFDGERLRRNERGDIGYIADLAQNPWNDNTESLMLVRHFRNQGRERTNRAGARDPVIESRGRKRHHSCRTETNNPNFQWKSSLAFFDRINEPAQIVNPLAEERPSNPQSPFGGRVVGRASDSVLRPGKFSGCP